MAIQAMLSKGITLKLDDTLIEGLKSTAELSESTEKIEVTTLANENKTYINGLKDFGDSLDFTCVYSKAEYMAVRALQDNAVHEVEITYPDGLKVTFEAYVASILSAAEVNSALEFTIQLTPASDIAIADSQAH